MFATFGNITFETLLTPQEFSHKRETEFAEHARVGTKPKLQKTGEKLDEINLQMQFHVAFCNPTSEAGKIEAARKAATAEAFVLGTGEYLGTYVVASINKTINDTFKDGAPMCITLDVLLKEVVSKAPLVDMAQAAVSAAFATSPNTPLPSAPNTSLAANEQAQVMEYVNEANAGTQQVNAEIAKATQSASYIERANATINTATQKVQDALNKIDTAVSVSQALQQQAQNIQAAVNTAKTDANHMKTLLPIQSLGDVRDAGNSMRESMKTVNTASAPLATISAYRGVL
jgi:phage protein U